MQYSQIDQNTKFLQNQIALYDLETDKIYDKSI